MSHTPPEGNDLKGHVYTLKIPSDLIADLKKLAAIDDRTLAGFIRTELRRVRDSRKHELPVERIGVVKPSVGMNPPAHSMEGEWWKRPEYNGAPLSGDDEDEDLIDGDNMDNREDLI